MKRNLLLVVVVCYVCTGCWPFGDEEGTSSERTAEARIENLIITSTEDGTVEAEEKVDITNNLKWPVIIKSVVEEGTVVKKGDLIIEFECKNLEDAIDQKTLRINNAELALDQAKKDLVMAEKQHAINLEQARNALLDAEENLKLYLDESEGTRAKLEDTVKRAEEALERYNSPDGQKENNLKDAEIAITMARKRLDIAQEKLRFKKQVNEDPMLNKPYSESEIESDELDVESLKNTRDKAVAAGELLKKYEIPQEIRQLEETAKQAKKALEIFKTHTNVQTLRQKKTAINEAKLNLEEAQLAQQAESRWKQQEITGKEKQRREHLDQMAELRENERKLRVTAERAGLVLYTPEGWKAEGLRIQVTEGEEISPRQSLMQIPDMTTLRIKTLVFEALREYVKIEEGEQKASKVVEAEIDTYAGQAFKSLTGGQENQKSTVAIVVLDAFAKKTQVTGRVVGSSPLPKGTGPEWLKTATKAYDLYVAVDWEANGLIPGKNLRPGMGGKVTLILDEINDALTIPVLSVYNKKDRYYCMKIQDGTPTETEITLGKMNESRVQVLSGLREGDKVLLVAKVEDGMISGTPDDDDDASGNSVAGEGM